MFVSRKGKMTSLIASLLIVTLLEIVDSRSPPRGEEKFLTNDIKNCFKDHPKAPDLNGGYKRDFKLTQEKCIGHCLKLGYKYAGMRNGIYCYCGNSYGRYGPSYECTMRCSGDQRKRCGGELALTVLPTGYDDSKGYIIGCYAEDIPRDLADSPQNDQVMTLERCRKHCLNEGYRYAAAQNGSWCYCGNEFGKYGKCDGCTVECAGDPDTKCGGVWTNTVMSTTYGSILVQQHFDGLTAPFNRSWAEFKAGFGDVTGDYWIGNDRLSALTNTGAYTLRFDLQERTTNKWYWAEYSVGDTPSGLLQWFWAEYDQFTVADETDGYRIRIGGYSGDAGEAMADGCGHPESNVNGMKFTTFDNKNDENGNTNCANWEGISAGFWYKACSLALVNNVDTAANRFRWTAPLLGDIYLIYTRMSLIKKC